MTGLLEHLWTASLILAGASLVTMALVVTRRAVLSAGSVTTNELRDAVLQALTTDWTLLDEDVVRRLLRRQQQVANLITELATLVRGPAFSRVIDYLAAKGALTQLLRLLKHGNREDKLAACEALSHFPCSDVISQLDQLSESAGSSRLRIAALRALIQMGNQPSLDLVIARMRLKRPDIPAEASTVLKMATLQHPAEAIRRIAKGTDSAGVRVALIWAISEKAGYDAIPVLENLTIDNDERIRAAALHAIGEIGFISDPLKLQYCLADGVAEVRAEAASAIGKTGDGSAARMLSGLLEDSNWDVRFRAACALAALGELGIAQLRQACLEPAPHSRRAHTAAMVMSERRLS